MNKIRTIDRSTSPIRMLLILIGVLALPQFTAQFTLGQESTDSTSYVKAELKGKLGSQSSGEKKRRARILIDETNWLLVFKEDSDEEKSWTRLIGKNVIVTGRIKIQHHQDAKTEYYIHVKRMREYKPSYRERAQINQAKVQCRQIEQACKAYFISVGKYPESIKDLIVLPKGMTQRRWSGPFLEGKTPPTDPWQNEFRIVIDEATNQINILSAGPDETFESTDDISSKSKD